MKVHCPTHAFTPDPNALAFRIKESKKLGGPCPTKVYELAKKGHLKLIRIDGRTLIEGDSFRSLLRNGNNTPNN